MHEKILLICILVLFSACTTQKTLTLLIEHEEIQIIVELATTSSEHTQGLMYKKYLPDNRGMLFIFSEEQPQSFWMKNTYIPLDLIFFNAQNKIVDFKQNFQPCKVDPCEQFTSISAKYVLEVNAGFIENHNVNLGDVFVLNE